MINNFKTSISVDKSKQSEIKGFIKKVEKFAKTLLPRMGDDVKAFLDISELVGRGVVATLYIYGYNRMYSDEYEFGRVEDEASMKKQVGGIIKAFIGDYDSITASTYWTAKKKLGRKTEEIGPYVEIEFSDNNLYECVSNLSEGRVAKVSPGDYFSKLAFASSKVFGDNIFHFVDVEGKIVTELGLRVSKDDKKALAFAEDYNFKKVGSVGLHSKDKPTEDELDFLSADKEDIAKALEYVIKKSGVKRTVSFVNESEQVTRKVIEAVETPKLSPEDAKELEKTLLKVFSKGIHEGRKKDGSDWTEEEIVELMNKNDKVLYGALKYLYNEQTEDEKNSSSTKEHNSRGFNAMDAKFLSSLAEQVINRGTLSEKQKMYARKKLVKYRKQLTKLANQ